MASSSTASTAILSDEGFGIAAIIAVSVVVILFGLFSLPRAVARFSSGSAWKQGWLLRFSAPKTRSHLSRQPTTKRLPDIEKGSDQQIPFPSLGRSASTLHRIAQYNRQRPRVAPTHFPSWKTILFPLSRTFSSRLFGYSVAQVSILFLYAVMIGIVMLLFCNPVTNAKRAGWIALSQYPVAFALASKNSFVGLLVGRGYERLNYIHRWVGQLMFIATLFHVVGYLVMWTKAGTIETKMTRTVATCGIIALGAMSFLAICSLPAIRKKSYTLFWHTHWIGYSVLLISTCYHVPAAIPYSLASTGIYAIDIICRLIKSHYVTATIHYVPEMSATRVTVPHLRNGWRAGQHVRLTVLSSGMGIGGVLESHPFTIASTSDDDEGLVLYCKQAGDWTKNLGGIAKGGGMAKSSEAGLGAGRSVNVIVQGPYGGPGHAVLSSYSSAMFVCGGSGITFGLSAVNEIMRDSYDRSSRIRLVDLVWTVQDPTAIIPLLPTLTKMVDQASVITSLSLRISIHYTRATPFVPTFPLPENIVVNAGRPELQDVLYASLSCVSALKNTSLSGVHGVVVGVCGPEGLVSQVRKVERGVGDAVRKAVGGVELIEESFGW